MKELKEVKRIANDHDANEAREMFPNPQEFAKHFSYRKGSKQIAFTKVDVIARQWRKLRSRPRFWDREEELDEMMEIEDINDD